MDKLSRNGRSSIAVIAIGYFLCIAFQRLPSHGSDTKGAEPGCQVVDGWPDGFLLGWPVLLAGTQLWSTVVGNTWSKTSEKASCHSCQGYECVEVRQHVASTRVSTLPGFFKHLRKTVIGPAGSWQPRAGRRWSQNPRGVESELSLHRVCLAKLKIPWKYISKEISSWRGDGINTIHTSKELLPNWKRIRIELKSGIYEMKSHSE